MRSAYVLLAQVVEVVSGQTMREFANENIFKPLGMHNTTFTIITVSLSKTGLMDMKTVTGNGKRTIPTLRSLVMVSLLQSRPSHLVQQL